jgi:hypothetical protein
MKMAIGEIIIHKIWIKGQIGCYEISSENFDMNNFYMCINRSTKIIKFFATNNFDENPIRIIDYNKNEKMGILPGVPMKVFGIVLLRAFKVLKMDTFPEYLNYAA